MTGSSMTRPGELARKILCKRILSERSPAALAWPEQDTVVSSRTTNDTTALLLLLTHIEFPVS
jgi:hypothetical protein